MNESDQDRMLRALSQLPEDVPPARDLWAGIAEEIAASKPQPRRHIARWAAALASVSIAASIGYYAAKTPVQVAPALEAPQVAAASQGQPPSWFSAEITPVVLGPDYQKARMNLATDLFHRIEQLSPDERAKVEVGLKQIDSGLRSIGEALAAHPDSLLLQQLVLSAYSQELQFMQDVSTTTNAALGRSTT